MSLSEIIILGVFIGSIVLISTNKLNRAIIILTSAIITYFIVYITTETAPFETFIGYLFGTEATNYSNLHLLILLIGMMLIVQVCHSSGIFQFFAFKLIQFTKGSPIYLLFMVSLVTLFLSSVVDKIIAIVILIPLVIIASRILNIDPSPYIITTAITMNVGSMIFPVGSVTNMLIFTYAGSSSTTTLSFTDFFINVGLFAFILFAITYFFFHYMYRKKLMVPKEKFVEVLQDFNAWNYVPDRKLFYKSLSLLIALLVCFIIIPSFTFPNYSLDIIALTGGIIMAIVSKINGKDIIKSIDFELILYILGIFIITGAMIEVGILDSIRMGVNILAGGNVLSTILLMLWLSALLSSSINNIAVTNVFLPVIQGIGFSPGDIKMVYYGLAWGSNLGDNFTPRGENLLVMNLCKQNDRPLNFSRFFVLGLIATLLQLIALTIYFVILYNVILGLTILFMSLVSLLMVIFIRYLKRHVRSKEVLISQTVINKIKTQTYRKEKKLALYKGLKQIRKIIMKIFGIRRD